MPERVTICNTSPLLYLHIVGQLELLPQLYGQVLIPPLYIIQDPASNLQPEERVEVRYWVRVEEITRVASAPTPPVA
ncbi:MAG: hypothetical protein ISS49_00205 [Anaerolineae bacterium]|nr:hypothetical protein [Anaerolineae bacterium]